jgi:hypothetical protein
MVLFGETFVLGSAQNRTVALESWRLAYSLAETARLDVGYIKFAAGQEHFYIGDARYKVVASNLGGARGLSGVDLVIMDEIRMLRSWDAYSALDKTRRARPDSQLWAITTEGDLESEVLNKLQTQGRESIQEDRPGPLGYWEYSAPVGMNPGDPHTWALANPALGYTLDERVVLAEFQTDPGTVFATEVLCQKVAAIQAWVTTKQWDDCMSDAMFPTDQPIVIALEASPELHHVSIVAGAMDQGFHYLELIASYGGPTALVSAERRLDALLDRWTVASCATLHRSPAEASVARIAGNHEVLHTIVKPADWARACRAFYAAATRQTLRHPGGPGIAEALAATKRGPDGLVSSVHRINPEADIDAALAAVLAMWVPSQLPPAPKAPSWIAF